MSTTRVRKMSEFIHPLRDLGTILHGVQKPARYLGGELGSGSPVEPSDTRLRIALCFPDLYEIGMSNNAIRLIYNELAGMRDLVVCERVFAPAPDFEQALALQGVPLYTLESGIPLDQCDIVAFSIGYELLATNILAILRSGHIAMRRQDRDDSSPIVIAGGPAITNPHPFGLFLDAVYIGEAEAGFYELVKRLAELKGRGAGRRDLLAEISGLGQVWTPTLPSSSTPSSSGKQNKQKKVSRAVYADFSTHTAFTAFPVSVLPTVQSHGSVEIMRGCPNGCRFCHAGYYYRPQRVKSLACIKAEVRSLVEDGGYREITLASLSSGDYPEIVDVFRSLNAEWKDRRVSFQLPSLKVDTFTLPLLSELSEVRKSGLTFAVETPIESWQGSINKKVSLDKSLSILAKAKEYGFRSAKFYFMIGLPVPGRGIGEAEAICEFLRQIASQTRMSLNVTVGTFVPKPHTPYQRQCQLDEQTALSCIYKIKDALRPYRSISISYHSPFASVLEGLICRGDDGVGELIASAFSKGARLDAWEEYFNKDIWLSAIEDYAGKRNLERNEWINMALAARPESEGLPWDDISINISNSYYDNELKNSEDSRVTGPCSED
ncbi:MAG: TIGR03960 family B12-binding radical SAM protein, partial [Spirochaetaceae bacterium]|nr:TIGR03960 family B12-binding radical SAM protein [Spirochaetaceae bacterium]